MIFSVNTLTGTFPVSVNTFTARKTGCDKMYVNFLNHNLLVKLCSENL